MDPTGACERGGDSESAVRSRPRTSLGDGVVKPGGSRIEWAQLLRRIYLVDVLACPCGGRRAIVADISDSEVVVAILAHLGLPPLAPPIARARSPGVRFYVSGNGSSSGRRRDDVARAEVCREDGAREARGLVAVIFPSKRDEEEGAGGVALQDRASLVLAAQSQPRATALRAHRS